MHLKFDFYPREETTDEKKHSITKASLRAIQSIHLLKLNF